MKKSNTIQSLSSLLLVTGIAAGMSACSMLDSESTSVESPAVVSSKADGDIAVPANYQNWPKFVPTVDKPDQIREIYINNTGLSATAGAAFPSGTVTVMELYAPKKDGNGNPIKDSKDRLVKDKLEKIFVMAKQDGWGQQLASDVIPNGDWLYGAYLADGTTAATQDFTACRSCHAPLTDKDFIHRYDEHFSHK